MKKDKKTYSSSQRAPPTVGIQLRLRPDADLLSEIYTRHRVAAYTPRVTCGRRLVKVLMVLSLSLFPPLGKKNKSTRICTMTKRTCAPDLRPGCMLK